MSDTTDRPVDPRITPGAFRDVGPIAWLVARISGRVAGTNPPNLFLTIGRHRRLHLGWLHFAGRMMPGGRLPRRETELLILRVAHVRGNAYEFAHHVELGASVGVTADDVERVKEGAEADGWTFREQAMLRVADQLLEHEDVDDRAWAGLREHLDDRLAIELVMLVSHYRLLDTFITTLRIAPDRPRR